MDALFFRQPTRNPLFGHPGLLAIIYGGVSAFLRQKISSCWCPSRGGRRLEGV